MIDCYGRAPAGRSNTWAGGPGCRRKETEGTAENTPESNSPSWVLLQFRPRDPAVTSLDCNGNVSQNPFFSRVPLDNSVCHSNEAK